jgi:hypothetical protein
MTTGVSQNNFCLSSLLRRSGAHDAVCVCVCVCRCHAVCLALCLGVAIHAMPMARARLALGVSVGPRSGVAPLGRTARSHLSRAQRSLSRRRRRVVGAGAPRRPTATRGARSPRPAYRTSPQQPTARSTTEHIPVRSRGGARGSPLRPERRAACARGRTRHRHRTHTRERGSPRERPRAERGQLIACSAITIASHNKHAWGQLNRRLQCSRRDRASGRRAH